MATALRSLDQRLLDFIGDPHARVNPYPFYADLHAGKPVIQTPDGIWWVSSYEGCVALTRDRRWSHQNPALDAAAPPAPVGLARKMVGRMVLFRDPPDHTRLRALLGRIFTMPAAEQKRAVFREHINEVLDAAAARGTVDFKEQIARLIPIHMICDVVGLPQARYEDLVRWSDTYASMLSVEITPEMEATADADFAEFTAYLAPLIEARRREPQVDLITEWIAAHARGDLEADEIASYVLFTLTGGQSTTTTTMANGLYTLLSHPTEWARLVADPEGLKHSATDELLRFESAGRALVPRWATEDMQLSGTLIRKGEMAIGLESAANRDPSVFPDPDRFDIGRTRNRHLAFGGGIHICPGQFVARVEIQELIAAIADRYPDVVIGEHGGWMDAWILRGLEHLPMTLGTRHTAPTAS